MSGVERQFLSISIKENQENNPNFIISDRKIYQLRYFALIHLLYVGTLCILNLDRTHVVKETKKRNWTKHLQLFDLKIMSHNNIQVFH